MIASPHILGLDVRGLGYGLPIISLINVVNHIGVRQGSTRRLDIGLVGGRSRSPRRVILTKSVVLGHVRPPIGVNHGGSSRDVTARQGDTKRSFGGVGASSVAVRCSLLEGGRPNGQGLCSFLGLNVEVLL